MCYLSTFVIIEYVEETLTKLPSDSSDSKMHQSPFPSFAELLNEFNTPPLIIVGSSFVLPKIADISDVVVVLP